MVDQSKRAIAIQLFGTGKDALEKGNHSYAVDCWFKCTKLEPENLQYRQMLRAAEYMLYKDNKKGKMMASMWLKPVQVKISASKTRKKWDEVVVQAEEGLQINPWDPTMLYELANACHEIGEGMWPTAIWTLEKSFEVEKNSAPHFELLAQVYQNSDMFTKAIWALTQLKRVKSEDHEIESRIRRLEARDTIDRGKYDEKGTSFSKAIDDKVSTGETVVVNTPEGKLRQEIETVTARIASVGANSNVYVQLADAHRKLGEYEQAAAAYEEAFKLSNDVELKAKVLDCMIEPLRENLSSIKHQLKQALAEKKPDKINELKKKRQEFELEVLKRELEKYRYLTEINPDNTKAWLEMGMRFLKVSKPDEAIKALQKGRGDITRKWEACCWLGVAFMQKRNFQLAERNLKEAFDSLPDNREESKKQVLYYLGRCAEETKNRDLALNYFNEIAAIDYEYLDVAKRLDDLNAASTP